MNIFTEKNIKKNVKSTIVSKTNGNEVTHDVNNVYFLDNGKDSMVIGLETKGGQHITVNLDKK